MNLLKSVRISFYGKKMKQLYINVLNNIHAWFSSPLRYIVTTLALGSQPKQGFARLQAKTEVGSHTTYSQECEKV